MESVQLEDYSNIPHQLRCIPYADPQQLLRYLNNDNQNWLMIAASNGWTQIVEELLTIGFDINSSNERESAIDLAYEFAHYDTVLSLLNNNAKFPLNFEAMATGHAGLISFALVNESFHDNLQEQKIFELRKLATVHPHLKYFYNHNSNQSASFIAIQNALFASYEALIISGVNLAPQENFNDAIKDLNELQRDLLREIHSKHAISMPESHMMVIHGSIFVSHDLPEADREEQLQSAQNIFNDLNDDLKMKPILKLIGRAGGFKVIFDFKRDHIQFSDPGSDEFSSGVYTTRHIYIAAKKLLTNDDDMRQDVMATVSHETNHFAMDLTYDNGCKPYDKKSTKMVKMEYRRALDHCNQYKKEEEIVRWAFDNSDKNVRLAELIVRVPHMRIRYANDQQRLNELNDIFRPLFEFYDHRVLPDVETAIPNIVTIMNERRERFHDRREKKLKQTNALLRFVTILIPIIVVCGILLGILAFWIKPECISDSHCSNEKVCGKLKCVDPCLAFKCAENAECEAEGRKPKCSCSSGYRDDGNGHCVVNPHIIFGKPILKQCCQFDIQWPINRVLQIFEAARERGIYHNDSEISINFKSLLVESVIISKTSDFKFLPIKVDKIFPNLIAYNSIFSRIEIVSRKNFKGLKRIQFIDFQWNHIKNVDDDAFEDLTELKTLNLHHNHLENLSLKMFKFNGKLERLNLQQNQLKSLQPALIRHLIHLQYFDVSFNQLTTIDPLIFTTLTKLKILILSDNNFKIIPKGIFKNLHHLEKIALVRTQLSTLDEDIFEKNKKLKFIHLFSNPFEILHSKIFDDKPGLEQVTMLEAGCMNKNYIGNQFWLPMPKDRIDEMKRDVDKNCSGV